MKKLIYLATSLAILLMVLQACARIKVVRANIDTQLSGHELIVKTCSACHGLDGNSISPQFPKLANQQRDYIEAQLQEFKGHSRVDKDGVTYMWGMARLNAKQIGEISEYYSHQRVFADQANTDSVSRQRGQQVFENGIGDKNVPACASCHGDQGRGNGVIPRIAGQHQVYLEKQIRVFKISEDRPRGVAMKYVVHQLSDQDITDVTEFLSTMQSEQSLD